MSYRGGDRGRGRGEGGLGYRERSEVSSSNPFVCSNLEQGLISENDIHAHIRKKGGQMVRLLGITCICGLVYKADDVNRTIKHVVV